MGWLAGFEPALSGSQPDVLTIITIATMYVFLFEYTVRIELTSSGFAIQCLCLSATCTLIGFEVRNYTFVFLIQWFVNQSIYAFNALKCSSIGDRTLISGLRSPYPIRLDDGTIMSSIGESNPALSLERAAI